MNAATAYRQPNHAANDWARSQTARTMVRAAMNSNAVVYRHLAVRARAIRRWARRNTTRR